MKFKFNKEQVDFLKSREYGFDPLGELSDDEVADLCQRLADDAAYVGFETNPEQADFITNIITDIVKQGG